MKDIIYREDAINLIEEIETQRLKGEIELAYAPTLKGLMLLPSAERTGKWIVKKDWEGKTRRCICDQCGHDTGLYTWENPNYCENCGARMVTEGEENDT